LTEGIRESVEEHAAPVAFEASEVEWVPAAVEETFYNSKKAKRRGKF
jgi:hypothetical protein